MMSFVVPTHPLQILTTPLEDHAYQEESAAASPAESEGPLTPADINIPPTPAYASYTSYTLGNANPFAYDPSLAACTTLDGSFALSPPPVATSYATDVGSSAAVVQDTPSQISEDDTPRGPVSSFHAPIPQFSHSAVLDWTPSQAATCSTATSNPNTAHGCSQSTYAPLRPPFDGPAPPSLSSHVAHAPPMALATNASTSTPMFIFGAPPPTYHTASLPPIQTPAQLLASGGGTSALHPWVHAANADATGGLCVEFEPVTDRRRRQMAEAIGFIPTDAEGLTYDERSRRYVECMEQYICFLHEQLHLVGRPPVRMQRVPKYKGMNSRSMRTMVAHMQTSMRKLHSRVLNEERTFLELHARLMTRDRIEEERTPKRRRLC